MDETFFVVNVSTDLSQGLCNLSIFLNWRWERLILLSAIFFAYFRYFDEERTENSTIIVVVKNALLTTSKSSYKYQ